MILKTVFIFKSLSPFLFPSFLAAISSQGKEAKKKKRTENQSIGLEFLGRLL